MKKHHSNLVPGESSHLQPTSSLPPSAESGDEVMTPLVINDDLMFRDFDVQARGDPDRFGMLGTPFTSDSLFRKVRRLLAQVVPPPVRKRSRLFVTSQE